ncbi:Flp family type IVb pilin [Streptomyces alkaliterrae]|uniref:Flp family type IVb pilin n=1 Tax=Streptomyces alkaliterrae TaxID=2213162 RepID=A0A5P0YZQ3_9ACTN|nr:hypothetical protein [Streptomyces alkaliterrae]MBB1258157.1 hypothetical protein [Streptomyces alkaliterrae]MQS05262.1 hypothetical protein [Streptomyces alkaliterrae]
MKLLKRRHQLKTDTGQTAIEYLGILAVVAAIIVVLLATDFGTAIANAIGDQIEKVTGGD